MTANVDLEADADISNPLQGRVAIVHDYLTQRGGAERVVLAMARAFPGAPVHTSLFEPADTYPEFGDVDVRPALLNRWGRLRSSHRAALPLLAPTFSAMKVDAEVVLVSSSGWAHGVRTEGRKVVYCHAPARWLYQREAYLATSGRGAALALSVLHRPLSMWDRRAAATVDRYLVNSTRTRQLVRDAYGIDAEIVHPPHGVRADGPQEPVEGLAGGHVLCVSRLMAYKNVHAIAAAFESLPDEQLVVVGSGPDEVALRALAPDNVRFLSGISDGQLRWLYAHARALVAASFEDFGLTPVEAAAFGVPTVALRFGGYLDTVVEGATGLFFEEPTPKAIAQGLRESLQMSFDRATIERHAEQFSEQRFAQRLTAVAQETCTDRGLRSLNP